RVHERLDRYVRVTGELSAKRLDSAWRREYRDGVPLAAEVTNDAAAEQRACDLGTVEDDRHGSVVHGAGCFAWRCVKDPLAHRSAPSGAVDPRRPRTVSQPSRTVHGTIRSRKKNTLNTASVQPAKRIITAPVAGTPTTANRPTDRNEPNQSVDRAMSPQ